MDNNEQTRTNREPHSTAFLQRRGRTLVILGAFLFSISVAFPVVAGLVPAEMLPMWIGVADVALAFVVVVVAFLADGFTRGKVTDAVIHLSYRIYRGMATLPLVLLVIFFLVGESIRWNVLLPGLAWRAWVLIYVLPAALALWQSDKKAPWRYHNK